MDFRKGHRNSLEYKQALANLVNQKWRMNNLYFILNDEGFKVKFLMNDAQDWMYDNKHFWNLVLKSRQLGMTTFIDLYILDSALFTENIECAIIAHTKDDAQKILRRKIKYPYHNLPDPIKNRVRLEKDSESEVIFSNGSVISTGTSARSGTLQILHISEFAKVCAKYPEKAREIVTGSIETLAPGQELYIESTAEGREGYFYSYCKTARDRSKLHYPLNPQEFKLHFFPWYMKPSNRLLIPDDDVVFPVASQEYFEKVERENNVVLDREQRYWYINKEKLLAHDMKREHPSTIDEAFEQVIEGTYFAREFQKIREEQRITKVPYEPGYEVHTAWDLGMNEATAIWFFQMVGKEIRLIDYYENSGEGLIFYRDVLDEKPYRYGKHLGPHDIEVREMGSGGQTRKETAASLGINFLVVRRVPKKVDSIQAARNILPISWFDAEKCDEGIKKLELYRKDWDEKHGVWKSTPRRDDNAHASDAFQTLAMGYDLIGARRIVKSSSTNFKQRWKAALGF